MIPQCFAGPRDAAPRPCWYCAMQLRSSLCGRVGADGDRRHLVLYWMYGHLGERSSIV